MYSKPNWHNDFSGFHLNFLKGFAREREPSALALKKPNTDLARLSQIKTINAAYDGTRLKRLRKRVRLSHAAVFIESHLRER